MKNYELLIEGFLNGNLTWVKDKMAEETYSLGDLFEYYVEEYRPSVEDMVWMVKALS